jgi:hypothetical protein
MQGILKNYLKQTIPTKHLKHFTSWAKAADGYTKSVALNIFNIKHFLDYCFLLLMRWQYKKVMFGGEALHKIWK